MGQILNRLTGPQANSIIAVLAHNLPELDSVDQFPILAPLAGILVALLFRTQTNAAWFATLYATL